MAKDDASSDEPGAGDEPAVPESAPATMPKDAKSFLEKHGMKLAISIVLGVGLAWMLMRGGLPLVPDDAALAGIAPWSIPVYVLSLLVVHWFRAARWRHLLRPIGHVPLKSIVGGNPRMSP